MIGGIIRLPCLFDYAALSRLRVLYQIEEKKAPIEGVVLYCPFGQEDLVFSFLEDKE